ncbi:MAG: M3 family oligoendopeptidase [Anaerolineae bacterium]
MIANLNLRDALTWGPEQYAPHFDALVARELTEDNLDEWMAEWSALAELASEVGNRIEVLASVNMTDEDAKKLYAQFHNVVEPVLSTYKDKLNNKLLNSGLKPGNFDVPLMKIRVQTELFREENLPLVAEEKNLVIVYDDITGVQTVEWEGEEVTLPQLNVVLQDQDRPRREAAFRLAAERQLQDRGALNDLWQKLLPLRVQMAKNAGFDSYVDYRWKQMNRFDYTSEDAATFHNAIEQVVVPVVTRIYDKIKQRMGVDTLRPWDIGGGPQGIGPDPLNRPPLRPYRTTEEFEERLEAVFRRVDPVFGDYFRTMRVERLMDIENRKNKAQGGYCTDFPVSKRPFIFANSVGLHEDVQTMLHEGGHAFHAFESFALPYYFQQEYPIEFAEVASMGMELLSAPYLAEVGFYTPIEAARARVEHLETIVRFLPYMAVVDAFQLWAYSHPDEAVDPVQCDAQWSALWDRFIVGVDYTGLEDHKVTGWHRKLHIFHVPFYYIEYGLAQIGALQVWSNSQRDQQQAVRDYRRALALGGTRTLPELFAAAGGRFAFDAETISGLIALIEKTINDLDRV